MNKIGDVADETGFVRKGKDVSNKNIVNYGAVHDNQLFSISFSINQNYFFTCSTSGHLKKWSVMERVMVKNYGAVCKTPVNIIKAVE